MEVFYCMKNFFLVSYFLTYWLLLAYNLYAKGITSAEFLKIGIGARAVGMGEAFVGVADDVSTIYWNPAGTIQIQKIELTAMHTVWFEDIFFSNLAYCQKGLGGVVGGGINFISYGNISMADNTGEKLNETYAPHDLLLLISYSRKINDLSVGSNLKFIYSKIEEETATGFAFDIGWFYDKLKIYNRQLKLGAVVENIGPGMKFVKEEATLPIMVKLGGSYNILAKPNSVVKVALGLNYLIYSDFNINIGAEYVQRLGNFGFAVRCGYKTDTINVLGVLSGLTAGFGVKWRQNYGFDYAWVAYGDLGSTHRISMNISFGGESEAKVEQVEK